MDRRIFATDFDTFSEDDLPTNSDVVIVLSQYLDSLESWRSANVYYSKSDYKWHWDIEGNLQVDSNPPTRFRQVPNKNDKKPRGKVK